MKYIILETDECDHGIAFTETLQHKAVASALAHIGTPRSAGFIVVKNGDVLCHGESDSLRLKSRPDDALHFRGIAK